MASFFRRYTVFLVLAVVAFPLLFLLTSFFNPIQFELSSSYVSQVTITTIAFVGLVTLFSTVLGTLLAYITSLYKFPGSTILSWALFLPLAAPPYVLAFVHVALWETTLNTRSLLFASSVMAFSLYPYVYLFARTSFQSQGKRALEVAQSLGRNSVNSFFTVIIPLSWPWITGGALFVFMESLSDFGAVSIFNIDTLSVAIYKAWFSYFSISTANRLAAFAVLVVIAVLVIEVVVRRKRQFYTNEEIHKRSSTKTLSAKNGVIATIICSLVVLLGFALPFVQLLSWILDNYTLNQALSMSPFLKNSLTLSVLATLLIIVISCFLAVSARLEKKYPKLLSFAQKAASIGYALPGAVLAVLAYTLLSKLPTSLAIQNTILIILFGYLIRFLPVGLNPINTSLKRLSKNIDDAASSLGCRSGRFFKSIIVPNISPSIKTASLLVFIEVMKEMPITLMTRPFGWDTLSVKIFEYTSEGEWEKAALPAIILLIVGVIPVLMLEKNERGRS
jgi:iron(III) transport system permease protein